MSKILKNTTASSVMVNDTGVLISASGQYTIPPTDYLLWAASSDVIVKVGAGTLLVNDGSVDLSISNGTDLIKDIFPKKIGVLAGDDFTAIGHTGDRLKVDAGTISASTGAVDKTTFVYGTDVEQTIGGVYQDTSPSVTAGKTAAARITQNRALHSNLRNDAGTEVGVAGAPLRTDPTGTTTQPISAAALPLPSGAATEAKQTQPGIDIGDVTINNAAGAAAVNIQDGGNSITVDGTITGNQGAPNTTANAWPAKITDGTDTATVSTNGDLAVSDGLSNGGVHGNLAMATANTAYEAKVGGSRLANRKVLTITALDNMYWGYDNTVTTSNGTPLYKDQVAIFAIDPDSTFQVWLVAAAASKNARVTESP